MVSMRNVGPKAPSPHVILLSLLFFQLKFNVTEQFDPRLTKINPSCNSIKCIGVAPSMTLAHSVFSLKMWIISNTTSLIQHFGQQTDTRNSAKPQKPSSEVSITPFFSKPHGKSCNCAEWNIRTCTENSQISHFQALLSTEVSGSTFPLK